MFQFPRFPRPALYIRAAAPRLLAADCSIRAPPDPRAGAAPRGVSPRPRALHRPRTPRHPPRAHPCTLYLVHVAPCAHAGQESTPHGSIIAYLYYADTHSRNRPCHAPHSSCQRTKRRSMLLQSMIKHLVRGEAWWCKFSPQGLKLGSYVRSHPVASRAVRRRSPSASLAPGEGYEIASLLTAAAPSIQSADRLDLGWCRVAPVGAPTARTCSLERR